MNQTPNREAGKGGTYRPQTRKENQQYRSNYDRIFRKGSEENKPKEK